MKILVTGGAGFIGSHITDAYINEGHEVVIIDNLLTGRMENVNPNARFIKMDINDEGILELFKEEKFDAVNHQAGQLDVRISVRDPRYDANINVLGSLNIYEAARETGVKKIIFASSGGTIYGEQEYHPADEKHVTNPCSPYGIAKLVNEKYLYYYFKEHDLNYVSLRYGNVYGERQNYRGEAGVVAIFINKMLNAEQAVINGDGEITRDYVYIKDVVAANVLALKDEATGIYNVGTAIETNVNTIFRTLKETLNSDCEEYHGPAKVGEQRRAVIDPSRLMNELGWKPSMKFEDGMKVTAKYFKDIHEKGSNAR